MKFIIVTVGIVVTILLVILLIGTILPQPYSVTLSRNYPVPPSEIYETVTHVQNFPRWRSTVREVEVLSGGEQPQVWREVDTDNDPITSQFADVRADSSRIVSEIVDENLPFGGRWIYQLEAQGDSTRLTITENGEVYDPIFRFISRLIMGHERTIAQYRTDLENSLKE